MYNENYNIDFKEVDLYIEIGHYEQAISKIEQLLSECPNEGRLLYLLSFCYFQNSDNDIAIEYCSEAIEKGYSVEACNSLLGKIYMDNDNFVKAEEHFLEALRLNPVNAPILAAYGMLMLRTGHEKKAAALIDEAMYIDPENESVLHYNFLYYLYNENRSGQIKLLEAYVQNASNEVRKLLNTGIYNLHNKKYSEARECYRQAFLLDPTNQSILTMLEDLDKNTHIIFLPNRLVTKAGGPAVILVTFFIFALVTRNIKNPTFVMFANFIMYLYIIFAISTWLTPVIYKVYVKFIKR